VATVTLLRDLEGARDELDEPGYEVFIDVGLRVFIRESLRLGLDDWRAAA
jgi:hypothetical protein